MKRHILLYGIVGGILIALLQWTQYRFLVLSHSLEIYGALVAIAFSAIGIWLGLRLKTRHEATTGPARSIIREVPAPAAPFTPDPTQIAALNLTPRELEILHHVAGGLSNREIAATLFVSENTVKTHCSRAFDKLGARRRTQAVQRAKELRLLP